MKYLILPSVCDMVLARLATEEPNYHQILILKYFLPL